MSTITDRMFHASYVIGEKLHSKSFSYTESIRKLQVEYGMNQHSADDYLYAYIKMAEGKAFKRIISLAAICYYLEKFFEDRGKAGLQKALSSIQHTIEYRESSGNYTAIGLRRIYSDFFARL